jgi:hypothetical protein
LGRGEEGGAAPAQFARGRARGELLPVGKIHAGRIAGGRL